jgi:hypothetical protein
MVTIPKWVVYDIVLPTLFPMIGQDSFKQIFSKCLEVTSAPEETLGNRINKSHGQSYPSRGFVEFVVFADCELRKINVYCMCILWSIFGSPQKNDLLLFLVIFHFFRKNLKD